MVIKTEQFCISFETCSVILNLFLLTYVLTIGKLHSFYYTVYYR